MFQTLRDPAIIYIYIINVKVVEGINCFLDRCPEAKKTVFRRQKNSQNCGSSVLLKVQSLHCSASPPILGNFDTEQKSSKNHRSFLKAPKTFVTFHDLPEVRSDFGSLAGI